MSRIYIIEARVNAVLPDEEAQELIDQIKLLLNETKKVEIELADDKLKNEYGEDWLSYRDDRLKELEDERRISGADMG